MSEEKRSQERYGGRTRGDTYDDIKRLVEALMERYPKTMVGEGEERHRNNSRPPIPERWRRVAERYPGHPGRCPFCFRVDVVPIGALCYDCAAWIRYRHKCRQRIGVTRRQRVDREVHRRARAKRQQTPEYIAWHAKRVQELRERCKKMAKIWKEIRESRRNSG